MAVGILMGLLALDIVLPIPSSIIMISAGSLYGIAYGAAITFSGMMLSCLLGYLIGRAFGRADRHRHESKYQKSQEILDKWGEFALMASRPIPVLSESIVILAGSQKMSFGKAMLSCALGVLPTSLIYAMVGSQSVSISANIWSFLLVIGVSGLFLFIKTRVLKRPQFKASGEAG